MSLSHCTHKETEPKSQSLAKLSWAQKHWLLLLASQGLELSEHPREPKEQGAASRKELGKGVA